MSRPSRYGDRLTRTVLFARMRHPPARSVMSRNLPSSRATRSESHHCPDSGGGTSTYVGAGWWWLFVGASAALVRRLVVGLSAGVAGPEGRLREEDMALRETSSLIRFSSPRPFHRAPSTRDASAG